MHIHALHLGAITTQHYHGKPVRTAGHKHSVPTARLTPSGLVGDQQAERRYHGGPHRALCAYAWEHYAHWQSQLGVSFPPGAFSENLTLSGFDEQSVCLGDRYRLANTPVLIEVAAPRQPCDRLAAKLGQPAIVALIKATSYSGCYLRVHGECEISVGDPLTLCHRLPTPVTLAEANQVLYRQRRDPDSLLRVLSVPTLEPDFRRRLEQRLRDATPG